MPRIFVAFPVPDAVSDNLARLRGGDSRGNIRWVAPANYHLTLAFLGDVQPQRIDDVIDVVYRATADVREPLHLVAQGVGAYPNMERARVLWAGLAGDMERLVALQAALLQAFTQALFTPDTKRFRPHITVARMRRAQPIPARMPLLELFGEWWADEVQVIESVLRPSGPTYIPLADIPLE